MHKLAIPPYGAGDKEEPPQFPHPGRKTPDNEHLAAAEAAAKAAAEVAAEESIIHSPPLETGEEHALQRRRRHRSHFKARAEGDDGSNVEGTL